MNMEADRHAYLIMAHDQPIQLAKLIRALDDRRNDLYIHIDAKAKGIPAQQIRQQAQYAGVYLTERQNITWAGESQILCEMALFRQAAEKSYAYYHLISGTDFPIRTQDEIHAFFREHAGCEFIEFWDRPEKEYLYRIRYRYPLQEQIGRYTNDPGTLLLRVRSRLSVWQQKEKGIDRIREYGKPVKCGANWVSVTDAFVRYLLGKQDEIETFFLQGVAADELYKQTLCWNSPFRENIWPEGHLRLIDWKRGDPYVWQEKDLDEILKADALFVRKVTEENMLTDRLMEYLQGKREDGC